MIECINNPLSAFLYPGEILRLNIHDERTSGVVRAVEKPKQMRNPANETRACHQKDPTLDQIPADQEFVGP